MSLRETLADQQHEIWSHWMRYLFTQGTMNDDGSFTIPAEKVARWKRQMQTPYAELTEQEQQSDLEMADKIANLLWPGR